MARRAFGSFSIVALLTCAALLGAASASAAIVANGDFETGTLEGWTTTGVTGHGSWQIYSAKEAEGGGALPVPPSGTYAADTAIGATSVATTFLYQEIALPAATTDQLSLYLYYRSAAPMAVPTPDTLFVSEAVGQTVPANQQVRVDVLKPNAPIESLSPNDILATVYATMNGSPQELAPTRLSADLSALAGQTVRLRIAAAAQEGPLFAGVDDVAIASNPIPPPPPSTALPSNEFTKGRLTLNRKSGTGVLNVNLPGAGSLTSSDARRALAVASVARRKGKPRSKPILIKTKTIEAGAGGVVKVPIQPTPAGKRLLREKGRVAFKIELTFAPTGGSPATQGYAGKLVKALRPVPAPR
jgi:hypothetical protein